MLAPERIKTGDKIGFYNYERQFIKPHEFYQLPSTRRKQLINYGTVREIVRDRYYRPICLLITMESGGEMFVRINDVFTVKDDRE